ncbi:hypothetical protein BT69DRAFT_1291400 [Atractiella rhizophila]|nr:hypothetical protein BT69DRAFT_1291400 [Atractiella rhizophila]
MGSRRSYLAVKIEEAGQQGFSEREQRETAEGVAGHSHGLGSAGLQSRNCYTA